MAKRKSNREIIEISQDLILNSISYTLGYWKEEEHLTEGLTPEDIERVDAKMRQLADAIAKKYGYDKAWVS